MRYTVTCHPILENKLALIWILATDREAVRRASDDIDQLLKHRPLHVGEPFGADRRLVIEPLTVIYSVSPDDRKVEILDYIYAG